MASPGLLEELTSHPPQALWLHTPKAALGQLPEPVAAGDRAGAGPAVVQAQHPVPTTLPADTGYAQHPPRGVSHQPRARHTSVTRGQSSLPLLCHGAPTLTILLLISWK